MKRIDRLRRWSLALAILLICEIAGCVLLEIVGILDKHHTIEILFFIINPLLVVIFFTALIAYLNALSQFKELKVENTYNLGAPSSFFNYHAFENQLSKRRRFKFRKSHAYVIAFSACNQRVADSSSNNDVIAKLNGEISKYVTRYFEEKGAKVFRANCFCFYHGLFVIYSFMNNEFVEKFISETSDMLFKIAEQQQFHVFIQPFFGIAEVTNPKEDTFFSVENAVMARAYSEKNFQEKTYYSEDFRNKRVTDDEIKEILTAIKDNEFTVYYQCKYDLKKSEFISSEALVRWNSPKYGLVPPGKFIAKAEMGGIIHEIDMFVFRRVCEDLSETKRKGRRMLPVSVNFSLYEFYAPNFLRDLMDILNSFDLDPKYIEIEVTETTTQANSFLAVSILNKIREQGLNILMDDFGIGYSNLTNLNKLPIDKVKIDKSFIDDLVNDSRTRETVRYLIQLCKVNKMESIAEGVDDPKQVEILKKLDCDTIQGYYYSLPIPKEEYDKFLISNKFEKKAKGGKK